MTPSIPMRRGRFAVLAALAAGAVTAVRLYRLDSLQLDLYGDIALVHQYISHVRDGDWPFYLITSIGPLYAYLAAPITLATGMSYTGLKAASAVISLGALLATYALARRLVNDAFALLAVAIAGLSSWLLIFSRLGGTPVIVPLLAACAMWLAVRFAERGRTADLAACAIVSGLGVYGYAPSFALPAVSFIVLACLRGSGFRVTRQDLLRFAGVSALVMLPFLWLASPADLMGTYFGSRLRTGDSPVLVFARNAVSALLAFHVRGDAIFRSNPAGLPHLDPASGVLLLAGLVFWLRPERRRLASAVLVPFVLLQVPSMLALSRPEEVPSAGRTIGAAPFAYILVASGLWWALDAITRAGQRRLAVAATVLSLAAIAWLNVERYFRDYIGGLPYHDTSIGREIATLADAVPDGTAVHVVGCCWESAMPEVPFVRLAATHPRRILEISEKALTCETLRSLPAPAILVWSYREELPAPALAACREIVPPVLHRSAAGWPLFHAGRLQADAGPGSNGPSGQDRSSR